MPLLSPNLRSSWLIILLPSEYRLPFISISAERHLWTFTWRLCTGSVSTATAVEHRQAIERLFEALMAAWRLKWHTTILTRFILQNQTNSVCQDAVEALFEALADQRGTVLDGSSSAVGLLRWKTIDTSSLGASLTKLPTMKPLRSLWRRGFAQGRRGWQGGWADGESHAPFLQEGSKT